MTGSDVEARDDPCLPNQLRNRSAPKPERDTPTEIDEQRRRQSRFDRETPTPYYLSLRLAECTSPLQSTTTAFENSIIISKYPRYSYLGSCQTTVSRFRYTTVKNLQILPRRAFLQLFRRLFSRRWSPFCASQNIPFSPTNQKGLP
jgi:hypothetical protein